MEHKSDGDISLNWSIWYNHRKIDTKTGGLGNKKKSRDHPNYSVAEISQNTEKRTGDLRRLAVTKTPLRNHQLILV